MPVSPPATSSTKSSPLSEAILKLDISDNHARSNDSTTTSSLASFDRKIFEDSQLPPIPDFVSSDLPAQSLTELYASSTDTLIAWLTNATQAVSALDAGGDLSWALQIRMELQLVEKGVQSVQTRLEQLSKVVEDLSGSLTKAEVKRMVTDLEAVTTNWEHLTSLTKRLRFQSLIATDWEDCEKSLELMLSEVRELNASIYLVEERRHIAAPDVTVELEVLAAILDDVPDGENTGTPGKQASHDSLSQWDREFQNTVLRLASKLTPLAASLQMFRPRLELFEHRAAGRFATALDGLQARYTKLNSSFDALVEDFKRLKRELSDDKWLTVYRQVNKQASEMMDSIARTVKKLESVPFTSPGVARWVDAFEMKSEHYGKAIPAVLAIMHRGIRDRLTLNGEVIRGYNLLTDRWTKLQDTLAVTQKRILGGRAAGLLPGNHGHNSAAKLPSKQNVAPRSNVRKKDRLNATELKTPKGTTAHGKRSSSRLAVSPSPHTFQKDTSLDPPRSRSRMSMCPTPEKHDNRPRWNGGTVARVIDTTSIPGSPIRTPSKLGSHLPGRAGARSSLATSHYSSPIKAIPAPNRRTTGIPSLGRSTHSDVEGRSSLPQTPARHNLLAKTTKIDETKVHLPPVTPSRSRVSPLRPKTPTSIPVLSRRIASNPEGTMPTIDGRPRTTGTLLHSGRSSSLAGPKGRRASGIPMPSPKKL